MSNRCGKGVRIAVNRPDLKGPNGEETYRKLSVRK